MSDDLPQHELSKYCEIPAKLWLPAGWENVHVAVALSGGADSVALLCLLVQVKRDVGGTGNVYALHVNHQLRGQESAADARWCQQLCEQLSVPVEILKCEPTSAAAEAGDGLEAAARELRYRVLTQTAEQLGIRYLATAHTRDDQVETVLFRILRGTGLRGLAGIPRTRSLTPALTLIRPMLESSREMVIDYLSQLGQPYRNDCSNTDRTITRNRLRHELLPLLRQQYNQEVDQSLLNLASQADDVQCLIERDAERLANEATNHIASGQLNINLTPLAEHDSVLVREALRTIWRRTELPEQAMSYQWWHHLADLVLKPTAGATLNLPGGVRASIAEQALLLQWDADC